MLVATYTGRTPGTREAFKKIEPLSGTVASLEAQRNRATGSPTTAVIPERVAWAHVQTRNAHRALG